MSRIGLLLLACSLPGVAWAEEAPGPNLWAVQGLYGLERSACGRDAASTTGELDGAMVAPALCPALVLARRQEIGARFAQLVAARFPKVEARFAASLPADATPAARLNSTLIVSLRLSRATIWRIDKPVGTDAFLPLTLTLDITNAATGEVVFTRTRSEVAQGTFAADAVNEALVRQLPAHLDATMQALVGEAAAAWKPWAQTATVVGEAGGGWVVDRGRAQGLRIGDAVGEDGRVTYAGAGYSVVKPTLGTYSVGQVLTRTAVAPAALLAKPSVLTIVTDAPEGYAAPYLTQLFDDALGNRGSFAPVPINPGFVNLRSMALGQAAQAPLLQPRSLPDYVASVVVAPLAPASFVSNLPGVTLERHEAHAFVTLVDRTGRVVASFHGVGGITDEVSGTMRFSPDQRRDTVVRNALIDAARQMAAFRVQPLSLPIVRVGGNMLVRDAGGAVPLGAQFMVLRDAGRMKGIDGPVLVPVGRVGTTELSEGGVLATDVDAAPIALASGDVVALENGGGSFASRRAFMRCRDATGWRVDDRGTIAMPLWKIAADAALAARFGAPVYVASLPDTLAGYGGQFADWKKYAPAQSRQADGCFVPVIAVAARGTGYDLTVGYTLMNGSQKLAGGGVRALLTPTRLPNGSSADAASAMLQFDLAAQILPMAEKAAAGLLRAE